MTDSPEDPHADQPTVTAGADLADAEAAVVLCHGRGAQARSVLGLSEAVDVGGVAYLAPQAARNTWYPNSFMAPVDTNQPWLDGALSFVDRTIGAAADADVPREKIVLGGFSQGACLASEYAVRNPTRYGGIAALSGGLIGPEGTSWDTDGSLDDTPAFVGCSDQDPHIPIERVDETIETLEVMDADVDERIYDGLGHRINTDEQAAVADMIGATVEA